jgi:hypothetical protein
VLQAQFPPTRIRCIFHHVVVAIANQRTAVTLVTPLHVDLRTAAAVMLFDEEKIGFDDPVAWGVPDFKWIKVGNASSELPPT